MTPDPRSGVRRGRRLTGGRLVGLDRSGPEPAETRKGQPLRPLTLPNLIGYARLVAIPVFLYLVFAGPGAWSVDGAPGSPPAPDKKDPLPWPS